MLDLLIVTGASKGIGASITKQCSNICKNMIVISSSDNINKITDVNKSCNIIKLQIDLSNYNSAIEETFNIVNQFKNINSLGIVLCAAQIGEYGGLFSSDLDDWEKLYKCNVLGNLAVIKGCSEIIKSGTETKIVFFGGGGAASGYPDFSGYALSKVATIRAAENLSMEFSKSGYNTSVISVAPGAVDTDMLKKVIVNGGHVATKTDISEPTNFVFKFLNNEFPTQKMNGRFVHVRDDIESTDFSNNNIFKLRRIQ